MKEQLNSDYRHLIEMLRTCPEGEERDILDDYSDLLNEGLLEVMEEVADELLVEENEEGSDWLRSAVAKIKDLIQIRYELANSQGLLIFFLEVLEAIEASEGNAEVVYPILEKNLDKLDDNFDWFLRSWATDVLAKVESEEAYDIATVIGTFSGLIQYFPRGECVNNIEIAIAGYQQVAAALNREDYQEDWVIAQNHLGFAYQIRIAGNRSRNLERAIKCYELALQCCNDTDEPQLWSVIQHRLGLVYFDRVEGDLEENMERAIAAFELALKVCNCQEFPLKTAEIQHDLGLAYLHRVKGDEAENIELGIKYYQAALGVYPKEDNPTDWARIQNNLGLAYYNRIQGQKLDNSEMAIATFHNALQVRTYTDYPIQWAETQESLGNAYITIEENRDDNLQKAIECYQAALTVYSAEDFPEQSSTIQFCMGDAYRQKIENRAENIEKAIECYQTALQICNKEEFPELWAFIHNDLGATYLSRFKGSQEQNIELGRSLIEATLQVYNCEDYPDNWANTQNNLGFSYYLSTTGKYSDNLERAIAYYELGLQVYNSETFTEVWGLIQLNLGVAYLERLKGDFSENIESSIAASQNALTIYNPESYLENWLKIQNNLGYGYQNRVTGERVDNLEKALSYYKIALDACCYSQFPEIWGLLKHNLGTFYLRNAQGNQAENVEEAIVLYLTCLESYQKAFNRKQWSMIQNNLGIAYLNRKYGSRLENIELAIEAFNNALQVRNYENYPEQWAETQQHLGVAHSERIYGDSLQSLESAIKCYENALLIYTRSDFPEQWAMLQNNIGSAYSERLLGDEDNNLEIAIDYYQMALQVNTRQINPENWAMMQNNLGNAYRMRSSENDVENLEMAIFYYKSALEVYTQKYFPEDWAMVQLNLGYAYSDRTQGSIDENLKLARDYYQAALEVYTLKDFPENWATVQNNLGYLYHNLEQFTEAIQYFKLALKVRTPQAFPQLCLISGQVLGQIAFKLGLWREAIEGYCLAIEALEQLRVWANTDRRRQEILGEDIYLYEHIVQALVNTKNFPQAFEYVERSRSRRLVDLIASNDLYSQGDIPSEVEEYLAEFEGIQRQIDCERSGLNKSSKKQKLIAVRAKDLIDMDCTRNRAALEAISENIQGLESEKQQIWEQLRRLDPVLAGEIQVSPPNLTAIQELIDRPTTAILNFYTTEEDTYIFVLRQAELNLYKITRKRGKNLQKWINENWLKPYFDSGDSSKSPQEQLQCKAKWRNRITQFLAKLSRRLQIDNLISQYLNNIEELIIVPHLCLHQIPFAALPLENGQYLGDKFLIRYSPSCQVLEFCHKRPPVNDRLMYGIVEDATEDLPCASFEGEQIAKLYNIRNEQHLRGRSQATVSNYRQLSLQVQGIISSHHAQSRLDNPLESRLELADGSITLGQLMTPGWRLPHLVDVFLSCCETGLGTTEITDDILTLSTGFLCAGARSVVSTLWAVDDLATALFSIFYHKLRQEGSSRPKALQQAQRNLRSLSGSEFVACYSPQLADLLDRKFEEAEGDRRFAENQRNSYPEGSPDYLQWLQEEEKRAETATRNYKTLQRLEIISCLDFPFADPFYWAAFTCSGLR
ncbi:CHAT domain-containing tetratricopeptide repeat protein [Microcoleus sp. B4-C1]|uniref:CHAT domain-containing tetratricopeptide repeat protein n=1 Tax=Microcoleus sp. B4-C1 TaxID=2818660 RepID=UPI002FD3753F